MVDPCLPIQKSMQKNIRMLVNMLVRVIKGLVRELAYIVSFSFERLCAGLIAACRGEVILRSRGDHVFFGYYDVSPFCADGRRVLATRVSKDLSSPAPNRVMEVGYFDISRPNRFTTVGLTTAWCWQQGCRLQWYPGYQGESFIFYNALEGGKYVGIVCDINSGEVKVRIPLPLYDISKDGRWGLSLDFSRLQRLRPGYGYSTIMDCTSDERIPREGGVSLYSFESQESRILISYERLLTFSPVESMKNAEHYINHLSFNPSGAAFIFLHLWQLGGKRYSRLLWVDREQGTMQLLNNSGRVSHYAWRGDSDLLVYCATAADSPLSYHQYRVGGSGFEVAQVAANVLKVDGHPTYVNGWHGFITDTYPDRWARQTLMLYSATRDAVVWSRSYFRSRKFTGECRADLHPRLDCSKKVVCVDDEMHGDRVMRIVKIGGLNGR